jgi:hypothetical protein
MDEVNIASQAERGACGASGVLATTWSERTERDLGSPRQPRCPHAKWDLRERIHL